MTIIVGVVTLGSYQLNYLFPHKCFPTNKKKTKPDKQTVVINK